MEMLSSSELARMARQERLSHHLTQDQMANLISKRVDTKSCTRQAISQAENPDSGSKLDGLRIKVIESLTGRKLVGPLWHFEPDDV
jgi:transcriptional regulator with XRE-family HTH domain